MLLVSQSGSCRKNTNLKDFVMRGPAEDNYLGADDDDFGDDDFGVDDFGDDLIRNLISGQ